MVARALPIAVLLVLAFGGSPACAQAPLFMTGSSKQPVEGSYFSAAGAGVYWERPDGASVGEWPLFLGKSGGPTSPAWPTYPGVAPVLAPDAATEVPRRLAALPRPLPRTFRVRFEHDGYQTTSVDVPSSLFGAGTPPWPAAGGYERLSPASATVTFMTSPPGAEVHLGAPDGPFLGRSGASSLVLLPLFLGGEGRYADRTVFYTLEGYAPRQEIVRPAVLVEAKQWPTSGEVALTPASPWIAVRDGARRYALAIGLGVVAAAFAVAAWRRRTARERALLAEAARLREAPLVQPRVVGKWVVGTKVGQGGSATVFRAHAVDAPDGEVVAIKILDEDAAEEDAERRRFEREVGISCRLSHPNIVRIMDWDAESAQPFLVMELLEGESLRRIVMRGGLALDEFRRIFRALLDATCYAHRQGVVHRDLKPENVITTANGRPKIVDFGIARGVLFATVTTTGRTVGTLAYLPPERFVAAVTDDPRSDQYALGVMGYEMLAGRRPYPDHMLGDVMLGIVQTPPEDLRTLRPDLPDAMVAVVERMMAMGLDDRYPTLDDALRDFDAVEAVEPKR